MFHLEDDQFLLSTSWERCFFRTKNTSIFGSWIPILNHKSRVFQYATTSVMSSLKSHVTDFIRWWCVVCYVLWKYPYNKQCTVRNRTSTASTIWNCNSAWDLIIMDPNYFAAKPVKRRVESFWEKTVRKCSSEPFVPIGCLGTAVILM